tara:strand:- start:975 stop:1367 length:393 start_codon:yes stop_codon:yes gene_type:complete
MITAGKVVMQESMILLQNRPTQTIMIRYSSVVVRGETMGVTAANKNRAIRQEALRDQLSSQGHVQHVIDIAEKLTDLNAELDSIQVQRLNNAAGIKLKLISKYLGDVKAIELTGDGGGDLVIKVADFKNT